ncbi:dCTP deaminase [Nitrospina sp. 32_T5]|uniref:dCTP deaminase n=1 Tax=unclassified Nitrospina TaxID=2638683 RepID=UPI003F9C694D
MAASGILTDQQIKEEISQNQLIENSNNENVQPCSYDLRIGTIFSGSKKIDENHTENTDAIKIEPGEVVSILTMETLKMPNNIVGTVFPLNGMSSEGLLVLNPGHIDPGFNGPITVIALNLRKVNLTIQRGDKIFTVIFERLPIAPEKPYSKNAPIEDTKRKFHKKTSEMVPKNILELILKNRDLPFLTKDSVSIYKWIIGIIATVVVTVAPTLVWQMYGLNNKLNKEISELKTQLQVHENQDSINKQIDILFSKIESLEVHQEKLQKYIKENP